MSQVGLGYMLTSCLKQTNNSTYAYKEIQFYKDEEEKEEVREEEEEEAEEDLANRLASCRNLCQFPLIQRTS